LHFFYIYVILYMNNNIIRKNGYFFLKPKEFSERKEYMDELQCIVDAMLPIIESNFNAAPSTFKLWFGDFVLTSLDEKEAVFIKRR